MTSSQIEIQIIAVITAVACALPGVLLILRKMAMMSDAISHTVLLGIVVAFFIVEDLTSPFLVFGAAAVGLLTVTLINLVERSKLVREDTAIGLIFPVLFSIAVILISRYAGNVHLDTDAILVGEIAFAPFDRLIIGGMDIGPRGLFVMAGIGLLNLLFIILFYKELKLSTFDAGLAATLGFTPVLLTYVMMGLVSVTIVGAFDIVGSILVVALMIAPPAAAYLLTDKMSGMFFWSAGLGAIGAISGYWLAHFLDVSIAGSIAVMVGVIFAIVFIVAPERGLLAVMLRKKRQRFDFATIMLAAHLLNHEKDADADLENHIDHLGNHFNWESGFANQVLALAKQKGLITIEGKHLHLSDLGRKEAIQKFMVN